MLLLFMPALLALSAEPTTTAVELSWAPATTGRLSLIFSRDLSDEPRLTVGSTFDNAGQIFATPVTKARTSSAFPWPAGPGRASFPFESLDELPAGPALVQAVLTPYGWPLGARETSYCTERQTRERESAH